MAFLLYVLLGCLFSSVFLLIPNIEMKTSGNFLFLIIFWLPLFILGLVLITIYERDKIII